MMTRIIVRRSSLHLQQGLLQLFPESQLGGGLSLCLTFLRLWLWLWFRRLPLFRLLLLRVARVHLGEETRVDARRGQQARVQRVVHQPARRGLRQHVVLKEDKRQRLVNV